MSERPVRLDVLDQLEVPDVWRTVKERRVAPPPTGPSPFRRILIAAAALVLAALALLLLVRAWPHRGRGPATPPPTNPATTVNQTLYVMNQDSGAVALQVSGGSSQVLHRYRLGAQSDMALSPDGRRLYAAAFVWVSRTKSVSRFLVYDTGTGHLLTQLPLPDWAQYTGFLTDEIAVSPDGGRVYVLVYSQGKGGKRFNIATFDVKTGSMLPRVAPLAGCKTPVSILPEAGDQLIVVCDAQDQVRFLDVSGSGGLAGQEELTVPPGPSSVRDTNGVLIGIPIVAQALLTSDGSTLYLVIQDGLIYQISVAQEAVERTIPLHLPGGDVIAIGKAMLSADDREMVLGLSSSYPGGDVARADTLMVMDAATWRTLATIGTRPFTGFVTSTDGTQAFTINYGDPDVEGVELVVGGTTRTLGKAGMRPISIYTPP
jgi:DNA-binding beta-propeller fold protein YncE